MNVIFSLFLGLGNSGNQAPSDFRNTIKYNFTFLA